jgi:hypothetical protein
MTLFTLVWEIAQLLEGKRLSQLTSTERALYDLLVKHYEQNRDTQWVWLSKDHVGHKIGAEDVIYAVE